MKGEIIMLKKSKVIALLVVCVMTFAVVQPAFAERTWGEVGQDTAAGAVTGGYWGGLIGAAIAGAAVIATGGLAAIPLAGAAIGSAALTGAAVGGGAGAVAGASGIITVSDIEGFHRALGEAMKMSPEDRAKWEKLRDDGEKLMQFVEYSKLGQQMYQDYKAGLFKQNWDNGTYDREMWRINTDGAPYWQDWFK